jgi:F420-non-reducing hydrogenase small subunit
MRIAIFSLSSCQGCQILLLSLEEYLYSFIGENNIPYAPFLIDEKELQEVDLALVEGTVRNGEQFRRARDMREKAAKLVALGTCACYGGVQGIANRISEDELLRRRYGIGTAFEGEPPGVNRLLPLDSYIRVDAYLPGCPPPVDLLKSFLEMALTGDLPSRVSTTVCAECKVSSLPLPQTGPHRLTKSMPQVGRCLLEQGYICMGPVTRDGCGAVCPSEEGVPCSGCRGPSDQVLISTSRDLRLDTLRRLARAAQSNPEEVEEMIKDPAHSFFKFAMAEPLFRSRRCGGTSQFIHRLGEEE